MINTKRKLILKGILATALIASAIPALADRDEGRHEGGRGEWHDGEWHGERGMRHYDEHEWRGGRWVHDWHNGRLGWWWFAGGAWYFYAQPIYPYPDPYTPPMVVQQQPAPMTVAPQTTAQVWYYCEASRGYYPYVTSCPSGWKTVAPTPPAAPAAPPQNPPAAPPQY